MEYKDENSSFTNKVVWIGVGAILTLVLIKLSKSDYGLMSNSSTSTQITLQDIMKRLDTIETRLGIPYDNIGNPNQMRQVQENEEDFTLKTDEHGKMYGFVTHRKLFQNER